MKHRMRKLQVAISLSVMLVMLITSLASAAVPVYVDHFDVSQTLTLTKGGTESGSNAVLDANALGGERDFVGSIAAGDNGQALVITSNNGGDSQFRIASGTNFLFSAEIQWDGSADVTKSTINYTGLSGEDLTSSSRDRFMLGVTASDKAGKATFFVYTDSDSCSTASVTFSSDTTAASQVIYAITYASFVKCTGFTNAATFSNVGAIVLRLENEEGQESWDVAAELFATGTDTYQEFGDLPQDGTTYKYEQWSTGGVVTGNHVQTGLYLGPEVIYENAKPGATTAANSDDKEDGVTPSGGNWTAGTNGGQVTVVVNGCTSGTCYLTAFIDWDQDGIFEGGSTGERIMANRTVANGSQNRQFDIPTGYNMNGKTLYARFRLTDKDVTTGYPTGTYFSGSMEDYVWTFGPTAVSLAKFNANASASSALPFAALLLPAGLGMLWVSRRRNR